MEEQLQELTAKLAAMETEKHSLATRNKVLETALATAKASPGQVCCSLLAFLRPKRICICRPLVIHAHLRFMADGALRVLHLFRSLVVTASALDVA